MSVHIQAISQESWLKSELYKDFYLPLSTKYAMAYDESQTQLFQEVEDCCKLQIALGIALRTMELAGYSSMKQRRDNNASFIHYMERRIEKLRATKKEFEEEIDSCARFIIERWEKSFSVCTFQ